MRKYHLLGLISAGLLAAACGGGDSSTIDSGNGGGDGGSVDAPPGTPDATPGPDAMPGVCSTTPVAGEPQLGKQPVPSDGTTFDTPVWVGSPPGDSRLFVIEQHTGQIKIIKNDAVLGTPFLDVNGISTGGEQGLLGLAFHPGFATNGRFFVNYTDNGGDTQVVEYHAAPGVDVADAAPVQTIISINQPFSNHNGGNVIFGPDGFLYIGMGDGGSANDPMGNGQNTNVLLGKMLRLDVNGAAPYTIPAGNPFAGGGGSPEIFAYGLRNPWRWSFDRGTGDLYIGDVGQDQWEEVDFTPVGTGAGLNYGWNEMEGTHCFGGGACDMTGKVLPVQEYQHTGGACSITGGFVYRGCAMPGRHGRYFFADYCTGNVTSFVMAGGMATSVTQEAGLSGGNVSSFGQDAEGELYIVDLNGGISKIVPQ